MWVGRVYSIKCSNGKVLTALKISIWGCNILPGMEHNSLARIYTNHRYNLSHEDHSAWLNSNRSYLDARCIFYIIVYPVLFRLHVFIELSLPCVFIELCTFSLSLACMCTLCSRSLSHTRSVLSVSSSVKDFFFYSFIFLLADAFQNNVLYQATLKSAVNMENYT